MLTFTVRQHGVEPLKGLRPVLEARAGRLEARAAAAPGREAGQYHASLVLPEPGNWTITIRSGFGPSKLTLLPLRTIAPGAARPAALTGVERGRQLFAARGCVGCHVRNELGGSEDGPNLGPELTGKRFESGFLSRFLADPASAGPPRYGNMAMPNPRLEPGAIAALAAFLNSAR
jgi:mono/diheme cytochrome c family protein